MGDAAGGGQQGVALRARLVDLGDRAGERQGDVLVGAGVFEPQGHPVAVHRQRHGPGHAALRAGVDEAQEQRDEFGVVVHEVGEHARLAGGDRVGLHLFELLQGDEGAPLGVLQDGLPELPAGGLLGVRGLRGAAQPGHLAAGPQRVAYGGGGDVRELQAGRDALGAGRVAAVVGGVQVDVAHRARAVEAADFGVHSVADHRHGVGDGQDRPDALGAGRLRGAGAGKTHPSSPGGSAEPKQLLRYA